MLYECCDSFHSREKKKHEKPKKRKKKCNNRFVPFKIRHREMFSCRYHDLASLHCCSFCAVLQSANIFAKFRTTSVGTWSHRRDRV
jgi:hypothetical protein